MYIKITTNLLVFIFDFNSFIADSIFFSLKSFNMKPNKSFYTTERLLMITTILTLLCFQTFSQTKFERAYGNSQNNFGRYAIPTAASGYAMTGYTQTTNNMFDI